MPPGSRKRKAAKKKREQEANSKGNHQDNNSSSIYNSQRHEDPRYEEGRESDGGEIDSPLSIDQEARGAEIHPFNEESDEKDLLSSQSIGPVEITRETVAEDIEVRKRVGQDDGCFVKLDGELNAAQIELKKGENVDHFESIDKSRDGDERNSAIASFDGQSQEFQQKPMEQGYHPISNEISLHNEEKAAEALSTGVSEISGNGDSFCNEEKAVTSFLSTTQVSENGKQVMEANNNSDVEIGTNIDTAPPVIPEAEVVKPILEGATVETSEFLDVVEVTTKKNGEKLLPTSNEPAWVSLGSVSQEEEEEVLVETGGKLSTLPGTMGTGNNVKTSEMQDKDTASKDTEYIKDSHPSDGTLYGNEGKSVPVGGECTSEISSDAQKTKDTEISDVPETQPHVSPASRVTERTSWMSCCGLFDVFTGSNR